MAGSGKRRKKKKHSLSFSVNPTKPPARVRKKWFPPMYVARPGALLSTLDGGIRSGHSGLFYIKTRGIVNKMVRDIWVFRSRSRRWPAAGKKGKRKTQLVIFCKPYKTPSGSKKKVVSLNVCRELGGTFVKPLRVLS